MNQVLSSTADSGYLPLGGFQLLKTTGEDLLEELRSRFHNGQQTALFFANTNFIVQCQALRDEMTTDTLIINDGVGIDIATWLIHRTRFPENLNGTDFTPELLRQLGSTAKVYLLGGKPGIAERAAQNLRAQNIHVAGVSDGYAQARDKNQLRQTINDSGANVLLVAMGNPLQERWILEERNQLNATLLLGVGALLDFLAGDKPRAPDLVRKLRLEWFYRLCLEPGRLIRRYTIDIFRFLSLCLREHRNTERGSPAA
ncbi:WecB/TagA/CpsF family glycosyltransferase [Cellvibrio mixtus]|uniref:WecB/TagA/CpsF family glycosyltransferase n=1 Tax=Cellvibrio mixtus TaxID=39650 RepID=UPI000694BCB9|nr:WecB/TagA/CpsF family glycosyltransferase [Cellvibrio mixtus]